MATMNGSTHSARTPGSGSGAYMNGSARNENTPRAKVTRYLPSAAMPLARRFSSISWTDLLRYELAEFFTLEHWQRGLTEAILTGLYSFGSILIICAGPDWGTSLPARTQLVSGALHALMFIIYLPTSSGKDSYAQGTSFRVHLNPAITVMLILRGYNRTVSGILIMIGQYAGATMGALAAKELVLPARSNQFLLGGCYHFERRPVSGTSVVRHVGYSDHQAFLGDFIFSFTFLYVSMMITHPKQLSLLGTKLVTVLIAANSGFNIYISALLRPGYSGSMYNPARCFGSAVAYGQPLWDRLWIPSSAPIVAAAAAALMSFIAPPDYFEARVEKRDIFAKMGKLLSSAPNQNHESTRGDRDLESDSNV